MHLARHNISSTQPIQVADARFDADHRIFTCSTPRGFAVYQTWPLKLLRKHERVDATLAIVMPLHSSSLLFLLGGGSTPLYPPNKVVLWDEALGREVAELEFREKVRGMACRRGWLAVALRRRVVVFQIGERVKRIGEWETNDNLPGLVAFATATHATLLAIPGRQMGHVQLVRLPPCPPPRLSTPTTGLIPLPPASPAKQPVSIIVAHESALTTIAVPPSGRLVATTSARGTLVRVWDANTGQLVRQFRRGSDKADIYGVAFRPDERELCVWSDKGTIHVFILDDGGELGAPTNRVSVLSHITPFLRLPKYFDSEWSYAQFRLPSVSTHIALSSPQAITTPENLVSEEKCSVGWIRVPSEHLGPSGEQRLEYQLVALTYDGGWYRLGLPSLAASSVSPPPSPTTSGRKPSLSSPKRPTVVGSVQSGARPKAPSISSSSVRTDKGKERERDDQEEKIGRDCVLLEFRRFGRWDGWA